MATTEAPKILFYRIEQCQEIATLAGDPYTQMQILNTVVCILMQAQVLPSKEFDTWEQTSYKMYPGLKTFIHEAYTRRLQSLALRTTTGQKVYAPGGALICSTCWRARMRTQTQPMMQLQQQPPKQRHSRRPEPLEPHMVGRLLSRWRYPRQSTSWQPISWLSNSRWRR
jgi:hypothetical protein